jgi:hypothetical protein
MKTSKCHFFLQSMFNISFSSHQIVLFGINTSDDSDGSNDKRPHQLNQSAYELGDESYPECNAV